MDSALAPDYNDEITYLNKDEYWETFVNYIGPKTKNKIAKIFCSNDVPSCSGCKDNVTLVQVVDTQFCFGEQNT